ncbi:hypothetical protein [Lacinutrix jangbogonensis]|uniref:hypothetical protein n=1 Tax=Lacinutrix jangbogonensis TaxID=1469557 RepID=UPI00053EA08F|nr:hypothetical protein [Lacinutrix jangbogonensis]
MKKYIKVLVFVSLFINVFSCKKAINEGLKFEDYDSTIFKAEKQLLSNEYDSASTYFNNAYSIRKNMLAFDMNNALNLAIKVKGWNQALVWSERLVKKGVELSYFEKKIFKSFHETKEWKQFVENYDKHTKYFKEHLDNEMIDSLEILLDIDQQAYCLLPSKKIDLSNVFDKTVFLDSLLFRLIKNKGFPNEDKIGALIYNDSLISPMIKFHALYRHSYQAN